MKMWQWAMGLSGVHEGYGVSEVKRRRLERSEGVFNEDSFTG
jgi:hypothetical protein